MRAIVIVLLSLIGFDGVAIAQAPVAPSPSPGVAVHDSPVPANTSSSKQGSQSQSQSRWTTDCTRQRSTADGATPQSEIKGYPEGGELVPTAYLLPAGTPTEFGLKDQFNPLARYYGRFETDFPGGNTEKFGAVFKILSGSAISAKQIPDNHWLVTSGRLDRSDTLVTVTIPTDAAGLWREGKVYLYACDASSPKSVSTILLTVSSPRWSGFFSISAVLLVYLFAALTANTIDTRASTWYRYLDPVFMTAGSDGKGSLSKLQILFFSLIVFGMLFYIVLRTGALSDLSGTILLLLGIAAVGSTAAKGADVQRNRIDFENWAWFIGKGWLPAGGLATVNKARWRDIVASDGEFDVYRYQNCIFSVVVGGALLFGGISQLSSFTIPETLLGILGLSQAVYVTGKLVSPQSYSDLNKATTKLRDLEQTFRKAVRERPDPQLLAGTPLTPPINIDDAKRRAPQEFDAYMTAEKTVQVGFESLTGQAVKDANILPSL
jgi:hypothetical protein